MAGEPDFIMLGEALIDAAEATVREVYPHLDEHEHKGAVITACSMALALAAAKFRLPAVIAIQGLVDNLNDIMARGRAEKREN